MAIIASAKGGGQRKLPPPGTHLARCFALVDMGTQEGSFQGEAKAARKVRISFELPNEQEVFVEERGKEPFTISREFTLSLHEKAGLRKVLESWRGRAFTPQELEKFDLAKLLGQPALVSIGHEPKKDGSGTFAKLLSVSTVMKGMTVPPAIMKPLEYSVQQGRDAVYESLPDWLKEKVSKCAEWTKPAPNDVAHEPASGEEDSNIPF